MHKLNYGVAIRQCSEMSKLIKGCHIVGMFGEVFNLVIGRIF